MAIGGSAAAVLATSGTAAGLLLTTRHTPRRGAPAARNLPVHTIGLHATLTGKQRASGTAQEHGARLAVAEHNARDDIRFRLALAVHDDRGEPERARQVARRLLADRTIRAVIGPTTTDTAHVAVPLYSAHSMPVLLVSVDDGAAGLSDPPLRSLCVTRASDTYRSLPVISYLTRSRPSDRTAVIEDRAAGDTALNLARELDEPPIRHGTVTVHPVAAGTTDLGPAVTAALATRPQAVVYAGTSPTRAAGCARALRTAGFAGSRLGYEPVMRSAFLDAASAAEGWVFQAPYTTPQSSDTAAARTFTAAYRARYRTAPARWSAEAYDAVGLITHTLDALRLTDVEPGQVAERIFHLGYDGVAKPIRFSDDPTHMLNPEDTSFLYQVRDREFRFLGRYDQVLEAAAPAAGAASSP